jgi:mannonate dehydratase
MDHDLPMRVGVRTRSLARERIDYLKQLGIEDAFVDHVGEDPGDPETLTIRPDRAPTVEELVTARTRLEERGVRMAGIQSLSGAMYDAIMFGEAGREQQLDTIETLVRNMGKANVPVLGYQWNPRARNVVFSTSTSKPVRGGAEARAFDLSELQNPEEASDPDAPAYDEAAFWERYESFLERILPVAEDAGVRLALHPADPPVVERLDGIPRLFRDPESFERAMDAVESDAHGLKLCLGCFSEMGEGAVETIERFGDDIVFVHFRDVVGSMPAFYETFLDDPESNFDPLDAVRALDDVGFDGVLVPDHVPDVEGDTAWGHRGRGHTAGYLKGLVHAVSDGA